MNMESLMRAIDIGAFGEEGAAMPGASPRPTENFWSWHNFCSRSRHPCLHPPRGDGILWKEPRRAAQKPSGKQSA